MENCRDGKMSRTKRDQAKAKLGRGEQRYDGGRPGGRALKLRSEIVSAGGDVDDVQMSLFQAVHGAGKIRPPYADPTYYGDITYPTERLVTLLAEIAIRLGAGEDFVRARAVTRLDQGMGGASPTPALVSVSLGLEPGGAPADGPREGGVGAGKGDDESGPPG